jgi:serine/threonine-protein kinase
MGAESQESQPGAGRQIGRYVLFDEIATGGMATVHLGRLVGAIGFSRTVAIKRLHPQFAKDDDFVAMFMDEARLAARIRHPNVVPTLDVVSTQGELFLVMEYVQGESLSRLVKKCIARGQLVPAPVIAWIMCGVLDGLHAAHDAKSEQGEPLHLVHRDVSPQNILIGVDGIPRLLDFGVAHAQHRSQTTHQGQVKGKIAYMSPEQLQRDDIDRRSDIYAAGVVLWEALTGQRLFQGANEGRLVAQIMAGEIVPPSEAVNGRGRELDAVCLKALMKNPDDRFQTAREFARAIEHVIKMSTPSAVGEWVDSLASDVLAGRADRIAEIESRSDVFAALKSKGTPFAPWVPGQDGAAGPAEASPPASVPTSNPSLTPPPHSQARPSSGQLPPMSNPQLFAEPAPQFRTSRRTLLLVGSIGGGMLLAIIIFIAVIASSSHSDDKPAASVTATTTATQLVTVATGTAAAPVTGTAPQAPPATATATATATAKKPVPVVVKPTVDRCSPPYTIDGQGVKHPKPECL